MTSINSNTGDPGAGYTFDVSAPSTPKTTATTAHAPSTPVTGDTITVSDNKGIIGIKIEGLPQPNGDVGHLLAGLGKHPSMMAMMELISKNQVNADAMGKKMEALLEKKEKQLEKAISDTQKLLNELESGKISPEDKKKLEHEVKQYMHHHHGHLHLHHHVHGLLHIHLPHIHLHSLHHGHKAEHAHKPDLKEEVSNMLKGMEKELKHIQSEIAELKHPHVHPHHGHAVVEAGLPGLESGKKQ